MTTFGFDGAEMRRRRVARKIRPELMAVLTGLSVMSISGYERGRITPSTKALCRIATALACSPNDLLVLDPDAPDRSLAAARVAEGLPATLTPEEVEDVVALLSGRTQT